MSKSTNDESPAASDVLNCKNVESKPKVLDRRRMGRKAPLAHPWRQYKLAGRSKAG